MSPLSIPALLGSGSVTPWLLIGALALLLGTNAYTGYTAYGFGRDHVEAQWNAEKVKQERAAALETAARERERRDAERKSREAQERVVADYQRRLQEKSREADKQIFDATARAGYRGLSIPVTCPDPAAAVSGAAAGPGGGDGATRAKLSAEASGFLIAEARRADAVAEQLAACQGIVLNDRSLGK